MSEPSKEAVEALGKSLGEMSAMGYVEVGPEELTKALQAALPIERQRWEQEVRERLEALDRYVVGTAYMGGHYQERTVGKMHLMNSENANGEKGQWVKRSDVLAVFGEAEPVEGEE